MRRLALPIALLCALLPFTVSGHPIPPPVPPADFPAHSKIDASGTWSGLHYFCEWSAACDAQILLLHSIYPQCADHEVDFAHASVDAPATCMGRTWGWFEDAYRGYQTPQAMTFGITGNTYLNAVDAEGAAVDFNEMVQGTVDAKLAKEQPNMLPGSDLGGSTIYVYKSGIPEGVNAYFALAFDGTAEIEADAAWISGGGKQATVLHYLIKATTAALAYEMAHTSP